MLAGTDAARSCVFIGRGTDGSLRIRVPGIPEKY